MIMHLRPAPSRTHTVSDTFIKAVKKARASHATDKALVAALKGPLEAEFPEDIDMRRFALKNILQIGKLILEGQTTIWIRWSSKLGMGIYVDE
jgi:hypothetical protein